MPRRGAPLRSSAAPQLLTRRAQEAQSIALAVVLDESPPILRPALGQFPSHQGEMGAPHGHRLLESPLPFHRTGNQTLEIGMESRIPDLLCACDAQLGLHETKALDQMYDMLSDSRAENRQSHGAHVLILEMQAL